MVPSSTASLTTCFLVKNKEKNAASQKRKALNTNGEKSARINFCSGNVVPQINVTNSKNSTAFMQNLRIKPIE
jgi:hypothetical protein